MEDKLRPPFTKRGVSYDILNHDNYIFETVDHAVIKLNLDQRFKYNTYGDDLVYSQKATAPCSGCDGGGCFECGYTGKRVNYYPQLIFLKNKTIKILTK